MQLQSLLFAERRHQTARDERGGLFARHDHTAAPKPIQTRLRAGHRPLESNPVVDVEKVQPRLDQPNRRIHVSAAVEIPNPQPVGTRFLERNARIDRVERIVVTLVAGVERVLSLLVLDRDELANALG